MKYNSRYKFLSSVDIEEYQYFPLHKEHLYLPRDKVEDKILHEIEKGKNTILLVKSDQGNGNTSLLNYLMLKLYHIDFPNNKNIISIQGQRIKSNSDKLILKVLFKNIYIKPSSFISKLNIIYCKSGYFKSFWFIIKFILPYLSVAALTYSISLFINKILISNSLFSSIWFRTLLSLTASVTPKIVRNLIFKKNQLTNNDLTEDLENDEILTERNTREIPRILKNTYLGTHIFIDDIDRIDPYSQNIILFDLIPNMKLYNIKSCVILYKDELSDFMKNLKNKIPPSSLKLFILRTFHLKELELLAGFYKKNINGSDLKNLNIATLVRSLTKKEEEEINIIWDKLGSDADFDGRSFLIYSYLIPFQTNIIPFSYLKNFLLFLKQQYLFLFNKKLEINWKRSTDRFNAAYFPILKLHKKKSYKRDLKYFELLKRIIYNFTQNEIISSSNIYHLLGLFTYKRQIALQKTGKIIRPFLSYLMQGDIDYPVNDKIRSILIDEYLLALFEGGEYLFLRDIELYEAYDAFLEILDRVKNEQQLSQNSIKIVCKAILLLTKIYSHIGYSYLIKEISEFLSNDKFKKLIDIEVSYFMLFYNLIRGNTVNFSNIENLPQDSDYSNYIKIHYQIKTQSLWWNLERCNDFQLLPIASENGISQMAFEVSFLRIELIKRTKKFDLLPDEIEKLLIRFFLYRSNKKCQSPFYNQIEPYFEARILHLLFDFLELTNTTSGNVIDLAKELFCDSNKTDCVILKREIFVKAINRYEVAELFFANIGMKLILCQLYLFHAMLLLHNLQNSQSHNYKELYSLIFELLDNVIYIENEKDISICLYTPIAYDLKIHIILTNYPEIAQYELEKFYAKLKAYDYPYDIRVLCLSKLLYSISAYGNCTLNNVSHGDIAYEQRKLIEYCKEYIKCLDSVDSKQVQNIISYSDPVIEQIFAELVYIIQPLKNLNLFLQAFEAINNIERKLNALQISSEVYCMQLIKDLIKYDLLCGVSETKKASILSQRFYQLFRCISNKLTARDIFWKNNKNLTNHEEIILQQVYEIIKRLPSNLPNEDLFKVGDLFLFDRISIEDEYIDYLYNEDFESFESLFPNSYLDAGKVLINNLDSYETRIKILRNLWRIASKRNLILKYERHFLHLLIKYDNENRFEYKIRFAEIEEIAKEVIKKTFTALIQENNLFQVRSDMSIYSTLYVPELIPVALSEKLKELSRIFLKDNEASIKQCFKNLKLWYSTQFHPSEYLFYHELTLLELFIKCYDILEPQSPKGIELKKQLFLLNKQKILQECDKIETGENIPQAITEICNFIKNRVQPVVE
jgi:hypothetical protein